MTMTVADALSELLEKAMIFSSIELQDGCHKGLPELDEFQNKVWILSENLDYWSAHLEVFWGSEISNQHLWRNLKVAEDVLKNLKRNLRSWLERWNKKAIPVLVDLLVVLNNILETGGANTRLPVGMAADRVCPSLSYGPDRINWPLSVSSPEIQEAEDEEGPSAVGNLGIGACSTMRKAMLFSAMLPNRGYKGSAEVAEFQCKMWLLKNHSQCSLWFREHPNFQHGHSLRALKVFEVILEKELRCIRSPAFIWKKKAFPRQLLYVLNEILKIVGIIVNHSPPPLNFGPDGNYVPISGSIQEVQEALLDETGPNVVTVYGGAGYGKSALAKYVAHFYREKLRRQQSIRPPQSIHFSDGVYFIPCGCRRSQTVRQLQQSLLNCAESAARPDEADNAREQEGGYLALPSYEERMKNLLARRKVLIILDNVWEHALLKQIIVPSKSVKYLITSQIQDICRFTRGSSRTIKISTPSLTEARQILANYTDGLPTKGSLPVGIQNVTDAVIAAIEFHPLSLANFGLNIDSSLATNASHWEARRRFYLDRNVVPSFPDVASSSEHQLPQRLVEYREGLTSQHQKYKSFCVEASGGLGRRPVNGLDRSSSLNLTSGIGSLDLTSGISSPAHSEGSCSPDCEDWRPMRRY